MYHREFKLGNISMVATTHWCVQFVLMEEKNMLFILVDIPSVKNVPHKLRSPVKFVLTAEELG